MLISSSFASFKELFAFTETEYVKFTGFPIEPLLAGSIWSWVKHEPPLDNEGIGGLLCPEVENL
ncbi:MAG: hypothetical protein JRG97_10705 [Deltaproteobacteria bacterium]|nr:hypothetical protein [Deltaproteobacteria bacterium]MBW2053707.1 hypothetical protein [Deltaproteobacteria bacterium]MBW2141526.1 hypothetical protein [Deltaproteobacteria bacterium]MBW2324328.1 hypothetical protein [Deltaproteobacteria bacterium]